MPILQVALMVIYIEVILLVMDLLFIVQLMEDQLGQNTQLLLN